MDDHPVELKLEGAIAYFSSGQLMMLVKRSRSLNACKVGLGRSDRLGFQFDLTANSMSYQNTSFKPTTHLQDDVPASKSDKEVLQQHLLLVHSRLYKI
jgi:hypothetical protein